MRLQIIKFHRVPVLIVVRLFERTGSRLPVGDLAVNTIVLTNVIRYFESPKCVIKLCINQLCKNIVADYLPFFFLLFGEISGGLFLYFLSSWP